MQDYQQDIKDAITVLRDGGVIYSNDTVWGSVADATTLLAVLKYTP